MSTSRKTSVTVITSLLTAVILAGIACSTNHEAAIRGISANCFDTASIDDSMNVTSFSMSCSVDLNGTDSSTYLCEWVASTDNERTIVTQQWADSLFGQRYKINDKGNNREVIVSREINPQETSRTVTFSIPLAIISNITDGIHILKHFVRITSKDPDGSIHTVCQSGTRRKIFRSDSGLFKVLDLAIQHNISGIDAKGESCQGLGIQFNVSARHYQYVPFYIRCYFYDKNSNHLKDTNYRFCDVSGNVDVETRFTPCEDIVSGDLLSLFIPMEELHPDYNKKASFMVIHVYNAVTGEHILQSQKVHF